MFSLSRTALGCRRRNSQPMMVLPTITSAFQSRSRALPFSSVRRKPLSAATQAKARSMCSPSRMALGARRRNSPRATVRRTTASVESVAISDSTALVGREQCDSQWPFLSGRGLHLYQSNDTWNQTQKLTASDGTANANFGNAVALDCTQRPHRRGRLHGRRQHLVRVRRICSGIGRQLEPVRHAHCQRRCDGRLFRRGIWRWTVPHCSSAHRTPP